MAPVFPRQFHHSPSPPRPPKEIPAIPVPVTRLISARIFFELFAGTICIFVLGVFFWKLGRCLRRFTRGKVLGNGKATGTRYAKTWYGWVPLQRHEAAKNIFRKCWGKLREWTAWKTTRADYRWVWWDPDQKAHDEYRHRRRLFRWLPKCLRSKNYTTADTIWNRGPPGQHMPTPRDQSAAMTEASQYAQLYRTPGEEYEAPENMNNEDSSLRIRRSRSPFFSTTSIDGWREESFHNSFPRRRDLLAHGSQLPFERRRLFWSLHQQNHNPRNNVPFLDVPGCKPVSPQDVFMPGPILVETPPHREQSIATWKTSSTTETYFTPDTIRGLRYSRKYQVWSARMQLEPSNQPRHNHLGFQEPPGTPISDMLASHSSENSMPSGSLSRLRRVFNEHPLREGSTQSVSNLRQNHITARALTTKAQNKSSEANVPQPMPALCGENRELSSTNMLAQSHLSSSHHATRSPLAPEKSELGKSKGAKGQDSAKKPLRRTKRKRSPLPIEYLSDWEIRWVDNLDRKLEWHLDQLTPGRRPFHFPLLANHWLNKKTWMVIDPVSRIPIDNKRQWGDPRFNKPYPAPRWESKPKYPAAAHIAHTPRIDSWRIAINRQRRASGMRDAVRSLKWFDGSVDEPPDGIIDPASWILRKPPQGFGMSSHQRNAYYEGGAGWQEKLSDWQRIRRGYRVRKVIHEGRVNRTRVKELVIGIGRSCQTVASKGAEA